MKIAIINDVHLTDKIPRCRKDNYLQAILNKLEVVLKNNDIVICLGDLFDTASVTTEVVYAFISLLMKYPDKQFYTIYGNHDLYKYSLESLNRTSLGLLFKLDLVKHLDTLIIGDYKFKEITFVKSNPIVPIVDNRTILLGHYFYECSLCPHYSITKEQIINSKAKYVFLGHDHQPYQNMLLGETILVRQGSVCRNTSNSYNYGRNPIYTQIEILNDKSSTHSYFKINFNINLEAQDSDLVLVDKDLDLNIESESISTIDIKSIIDNLSINTKESVWDLPRAINSINKSPEVINHIESVHIDLNLKFS